MHNYRHIKMSHEIMVRFLDGKHQLVIVINVFTLDHNNRNLLSKFIVIIQNSIYTNH